MARDPVAALTPRQREILSRVVEAYIATGQPVGSRYLVERAGLKVSSSTVRNELSELEARGLLTHPHTSAGRVPTEQAYRLHADELLAKQARPGSFPLDLSELRREIDSALEATSEVLSRATHMLALVSAPQLQTTSVRHVEVVLLNPRTVMAVVITSTGGVAKRVVTFADPVDPGLAKWAGEYLNERLAGLRLGTNAVRRALEEPSLSAAERGFVGALGGVFTDVIQSAEQRLYLGGAAELLEGAREDELDLYRQVLITLERRAALLELLGEALDPLRTWVRLGGELDHPALQDAALVGATYGLTNRALGAVGLLGPVRMDYEKAIRSVRGAAQELSRFVEEVYEDN